MIKMAMITNIFEDFPPKSMVPVSKTVVISTKKLAVFLPEALGGDGSVRAVTTTDSRVC